jgi:hypothetical protein
MRPAQRVTLKARGAAAALFIGALLTGGCAYPGIPEALTPYDLKTDPDGDGSLETARPVAWVNDTAVAAGGISIDPANLMSVRAYLGGEIVGANMPPAGEVDVFALGHLDAGDQVGVSVTSLMQQIVNLTPLAATDMVRNVAAQSVLMVDADREIVGYPAGAPIPIDRPGDYFLVVESIVPGDYKFDIRRTRGGPAPPSRRGVLLLEFGGSDSDLTFMDRSGKIVNVSDLPPFSLEEDRPDFAGQTQRFQRTVRQFIEYIYADYDVLVTLDPAEAEAVAPGRYDTVVFTMPTPSELGFSDGDSQTLGIEPTIDVENLGGQVGIIFIHSYEPSRAMDFNTYAAFWSTVAAHEYGHSVGLWHVRQESGSLMTPTIGGAGEGRRLKLPATAVKGEDNTPAVLELIENPDRYLSRIIGRRASAEADRVRAGLTQLFPEWSE